MGASGWCGFIETLGIGCHVAALIFVSRVASLRTPSLFLVSFPHTEARMLEIAVIR